MRVHHVVDLLRTLLPSIRQVARCLRCLQPNIHHGTVSLLRNKGVMKFQLSRIMILNTPRKINGWSLKIHPFAKESHDFVQTFLVVFHVDFQWWIEIIIELNITYCPTVNQLATMSIPRLGVGLASWCEWNQSWSHSHTCSLLVGGGRERKLELMWVVLSETRRCATQGGVHTPHPLTQGVVHRALSGDTRRCAQGPPRVTQGVGHPPR